MLPTSSSDGAFHDEIEFSVALYATWRIAALCNWFSSGTCMLKRTMLFARSYCGENRSTASCTRGKVVLDVGVGVGVGKCGAKTDRSDHGQAINRRKPCSRST